MRRTLARTFVAALVAVPVLVAAAPAAQAGTCPLLVDAWGDGALGAAPVMHSDQLDIRSADLASGATSVVGVLRVASLAPDTLATFGPTWALAWRINTTRYAFTLRRDLFGTYTAAFVGAPSTVLPAVTVDTATASITWSVPRSALPDLATAGQTFDSISASTSLLGSSADAALTTQTYVDQSAGCISAP